MKTLPAIKKMKTQPDIIILSPKVSNIPLPKNQKVSCDVLH
jgi:hypothetical protein